MSDSDTPVHRVDDELQTHAARAVEFDEQPAPFEAVWEMRAKAEALGRDVTDDDFCTTDGPATAEDRPRTG